MAKGNMLLGYARGKVGDLVFKRVDGKQVTTPRVRVVKNPRTDAQTINRIAFASASKSAQHLRGIVDHSFQGIKYGSTSINYFVSQLTKELASDIKSALASDQQDFPFGCAPVLPNAATSVACGAGMLVSKGDLVGLSSSISLANLGHSVPYNGTAPSATLTVAQFCEGLGITMADQITILEGSAEQLDYISDEELFFGVRYDYMRLNWVEDPGDTPVIIADGSVWKINPAVVDLSRSDARILDVQINFVTASSIIVLGTNYSTNAFTKDIFGRDIIFLAAVGIIVSRYEAGAWRRSTCRIALNPEIEDSFALITGHGGWNDIASVMALSQPTKQVTEAEYLNKEKKKD